VPRRGTSRDALVAAAIRRLRHDGYAATSVESICAAAGVTKGAFFHSFDSKEEVALAALDTYLAEIQQSYTHLSATWPRSPRARLASYLDASATIAESRLLRDGCLLGVLAREETTPKIARRCAAAFDRWAGTMLASIGRPAAELDLDDARFVLSVLQGSLILAKATGDIHVVRNALERCLAALGR
jgi:TetR/AcrR family transcriptional regulator, transcriptional repressor for nem operon